MKLANGLARHLKALAVVPAILIADVLPTAAAAEVEMVPVSGSAIAFYAAAATLVCVFVLLNAALRNRIGLYYAGLFALMLGLVWILDRWSGTVPARLFAGLIKDQGEGGERMVAISFALVCCAAGFFTAERAIAPDRAMKWGRRSLNGLGAIAVGLAIAGWFLPFSLALSLAVPVVNMLLAVMLFSHIVPAVTWRNLAGKSRRLPAVTAGALFLVVAMLFPVYGLSAGGWRGVRSGVVTLAVRVGGGAGDGGNSPQRSRSRARAGNGPRRSGYRSARPCRYGQVPAGNGKELCQRTRYRRQANAACIYGCS